MKFLCFRFKGRYYRWLVLPFGASCSPFYFCKIIREVIQHFRDNNLRTVVYVDDFYLCAGAENIIGVRDWALNELYKLGLCINLEKSNLVPSNKVKYIGYIIETNDRDKCVWIKINSEG